MYMMGIFGVDASWSDGKNNNNYFENSRSLCHDTVLGWNPEPNQLPIIFQNNYFDFRCVFFFWTWQCYSLNHSLDRITCEDYRLTIYSQCSQFFNWYIFVDLVTRP